MSLNLDMVAAACCGWLALCLFTLHVVSSPKRHSWMTIPGYVRRGFLVTGVMLTWWSANLFSVAGTAIGSGHFNAQGLMALGAATYTVSALAWWVLRGYLPKRGWDRLHWFQREAQAHPGVAPVALSAEDVTAVSRAAGIVSLGPRESGEAFVREVARHHWGDRR